MSVAALGALAFVGAPDSARTGGESSLEDAPKKIMCSYLVYGNQRYICGEPPLEDVKKKCNEKASEERGEKTECACTADQGYIGDACD